MTTAISRLWRRSAAKTLVASLGGLWALGAAAGPSGPTPWFLDHIQVVRVAATHQFDAGHQFKVGNTIGGRRLGVVGVNFTQHFSALVEENVSTTSHSLWNLRYTMGDASLAKAFAGGDKAAVAHLAYIHAIMEMGGASGGHTDWRSNFAYVRSPLDHRLWAVHWSVSHAGEWIVGAAYVPHADLDWPTGSRLFNAQISEPNSETAQTNPPVGE
jgi:hypothetical protein